MTKAAQPTAAIARAVDRLFLQGQRETIDRFFGVFAQGLNDAKAIPGFSRFGLQM